MLNALSGKIRLNLFFNARRIPVLVFLFPAFISGIIAGNLLRADFFLLIFREQVKWRPVHVNENYRFRKRHDKRADKID